MLKRFIPIILTLMLAGCGAGGPLASFAGAAAGIVGSAALSAGEQKIADRAEWTGARRDLVAVVKAGMLGQAQMRLTDGDYACWRQLMDAVLAYHDRGKPKFLIEKALTRSAAPAPAVKVPECATVPGPQ